MEHRKMTEFKDCPECGAGVNIVTNPTECYKCKAKVYGTQGPEEIKAPGASHYEALPFEPIHLCEHLDFLTGNVVKYVVRYEQKGGREDLEKALWYLQRKIEKEYPDA